jgi:hypothetical protein
MNELNTFAAWESALTAMGYTITKTSTHGSALFECNGTTAYRVSPFDPNAATAAWLKRTGAIDVRCQPNADDAEYYERGSDLPEFGIIKPAYRIVDCIQGSEEWDRLRARPTASNFYRIISPAKGEYSRASASEYASEIVAKRLSVFTEPPPSFWMEWGTENEPSALASYEADNGVAVRKVGFVMPEFTDAYGGSPDGLVGDDGLLEIKCPKPETLIQYHAAGVLPDKYKPQVQGLMMITGLPWCDFYAWHPELAAFQVRVEADYDYHKKIAVALEKLLWEIKNVESCVKRQHQPTQTAEQELDRYESADINL